MSITVYLLALDEDFDPSGGVIAAFGTRADAEKARLHYVNEQNALYPKGGFQLNADGNWQSYGTTIVIQEERIQTAEEWISRSRG